MQKGTLDTMTYRLIILGIICGILGGASLLLARFLIKKRGEEPSRKYLVGTLSYFIWIIAGIVVGAGMALLKLKWPETVELIVLVILLQALSLVDARIRKIPNQLLLALIVLRLAVLIYGTVFGELAINEWWNSLLGAVVGWVVFTIPGMFGLTVGWGDVKFAAVTGFYLKIIGMVQALLVMSLVILVYGLVLIITKKGSFKTAVAYGPALSLGILVTKILPITERLI